MLLYLWYLLSGLFYSTFFLFLHMVSKEVLSTLMMNSEPFSSDACESLPFSAIKTHLHDEGTYRDGEKFTVGEGVSQKSGMINTCRSPCYLTNG